MSSAKKDVELVGFVYDSVKDNLKNPVGVFMTEMHTGADGKIPTGFTMSHVPYEEFLQIVRNDRVRDMHVKDGELVLNVRRKTNRKSSTAGKAAGFGAEVAVGTVASRHSKEIIAAGAKAAKAAGSAAVTGVETAAVAGAESTALAVAGAESTALAVAGTAAVATETAAVAGGAAVTGGAVTAGTGLLATPAAPIVLGVIVSLTATMAVKATVKTITGAATRHKIYEYTPIRFIDKQVEIAEKRPDYVAVCVAGIERTKQGLMVTLFAYGKGLRDYVLNLLKKCPELTGGVQVPTGDFTTILAPYKVLSNPNFYDGYHLMFNTMNLHNIEIRESMSKTAKMEPSQLLKIAKMFDQMTENSINFMSKPVPRKVQASAVAADGNDDTMQAYLKKYGMTEEYFRDNEVSRLSAAMDCSEEEVVKNLGKLLV